MGERWQHRTASDERSTIVPPPPSNREPDCYCMAFPLDLLDEDLPEDTISESSPTGLRWDPGVIEPDDRGIIELAPTTIRAPSPWLECAAG